MFRLFTKILFLSLLLIEGVNCFAEHKTVSLNELPSVLGVLSGGDTVFIKNGEYSNIKLKIKDKKYKQDVVVRPVSFGRAIVTGESLFHLYNSARIKFEGFYFTNTRGSTFILNGSREISIANNLFYRCGSKATQSIIRIVNGSANNLIIHNTFNESHAQSILIGTYPDNPHDKDNTGNKIIRNYFYNVPPVKKVYPDAPRSGMECIMIGFGSHKTLSYSLHTLVYQNLFENIVGDGWEIISNKTSNNKIKGNTFLNNHSGLSIRSGNYVVIEDNYFDHTTKGIRIFGKGHVIRHNFMIDCKTGIRLPSSDFHTGGKTLYTGYYQQDSIDIEDNIIINSSLSAINLGERNRRLQPQNITILSNKIYHTKQSGSPVLFKRRQSITEYDNNQVGTMNVRRNRAIKKRKQRWYDSIRDDKKIEPFGSHDSRVGATWVN